ncbi:MAG: ABC transporter permease [Lachnospiraceae bacterium]|nr:ABC transporter permease [Lachnospiraceae bacterium]
MMKLYRMELYKLCSKKLFMILAGGIAAVMLWMFSLEVSEEEATIDGVKHVGFEAVQINREITEEFKGVLTDEKIQQIVVKYGLPKKVEEGWGYFRDMNFLNEFVMNYLTNAYINDWNDYCAASIVYPMANTDLGKVMELTGEEIVLEYYKGWRVFLRILSTGMIMGSVLVIFTISPLFANENQNRTLPLLFTTKEGKRKDIKVKIAAAFTVTLGIWIGIFLFDLLLCGSVYGFDGLACYNGMVLNYLFPWPDRMIPLPNYLFLVVLLCFLGIFLLAGITICISAGCKNTFHAVTVTAICWGAPILIQVFTGFNGIGRLLAAAPLFMVVSGSIDSSFHFWMFPMGIAVVVLVCCVFGAYRKCRRQGR